MKKNLLWLLPALLIAAIPPPAQAGLGRVDKSFGRGGKVRTVLSNKRSEAPPAWVARGQRGKVVVAVGDVLLEYLPDGGLDRDFGANGKVRVEAPPGMTLQPVGMTVDSRGRILVAGTVYPPSSVFVSRYLPDGSPDRSFGQAGSEVTDLGLPAPPPPPNEGISPTPVGDGPSVEAAGLAVDAADRPLLTGHWISGWQFCYPHIVDTRKTTGFVARLTVKGSLDRSFGGDGLVIPDPAKEVQFSPLVAGQSVFSVGALDNCLRGTPNKAVLARIGKGGALDSSFGSGGQVPLPFSEGPTLARDRYGRLLALGFNETWGQSILRLRPNGRLDRRFGKDGEVRLPEDVGIYGALATDKRGRIILASGDGGVLFVERRKRSGAVDRSFGRPGEVGTFFGEEVAVEQILVGGRKVLVGGTWSRGDEYGVALARYLAG
jgi:uncharacterized delta-60 repeat protein